MFFDSRQAMYICNLLYRQFKEEKASRQPKYIQQVVFSTYVMSYCECKQVQYLGH